MNLKQIAEETGDAIAIHYVSLSDLEDCFLDGNSKKHDIPKIIDSIRRYGFKDPITFDPSLNERNGGLIEGNGRLEALREMRSQEMNVPRGITENWEVPIAFGVNAKTEAEAIAYSIEHNWSVTWGTDIELEQTLSMFDEDALGEQIEYLKLEESLPLSFSDDLDEILDFFEDEEKEKDEEIEEPPIPENVESIVKPGQVWKLGKHKLACIDSTNEILVKNFLCDRQIELLFTSPPYADMRNYQEGTDVSLEKISEFICAWSKFVNYQVVNLGLKFQDSAVVPYWDIYLEKANQSNLKLLAWNVWNRSTAGSISHATNMFFLTHEWLFVFGKKAKNLNRTIANDLDGYARIQGKSKKELLSEGRHSVAREKDGSITETTSKSYSHHQLHSVFTHIYEVGAIRSKHPAVYPVGLPLSYIEAMTNKEDYVSDPFLGSGSTLIAAEQCDRVCYGCELSEHYCDVVISRWENLTGEKAVLERTLEITT